MLGEGDRWVVSIIHHPCPPTGCEAAAMPHAVKGRVLVMNVASSMMYAAQRKYKYKYK